MSPGAELQWRDVCHSSLQAAEGLRTDEILKSLFNVHTEPSGQGAGVSEVGTAARPEGAGGRRHIHEGGQVVTWAVAGGLGRPARLGEQLSGQPRPSETATVARARLRGWPRTRAGTPSQRNDRGRGLSGSKDDPIQF